MSVTSELSEDIQNLVIDCSNSYATKNTIPSNPASSNTSITNPLNQTAAAQQMMDTSLQRGADAASVASNSVVQGGGGSVIGGGSAIGMGGGSVIGGGASIPGNMSVTGVGGASVASTAAFSTGSGHGLGFAPQKNDHVASALLTAMDSDKFIDTTLVGRDNVRVPATKFVLASRCDGLQKVLYQDLTSLEIKIGDYGEPTLKVMKEFCHVGDLVQCQTYATLISQKKTELLVKTLVELCDLANLYNFPTLYQNSMRLLLPVLENSPWFMAAAYDAAATPASSKIEQYALKFLEGRELDLLLETNALKYIRVERIEKFLSQVELDLISKVQILQKWLEKHGAHKPKNRRIVDTFCTPLRLDDIIQEEGHGEIVVEFGYWDDEEVERIVQRKFHPEELEQQQQAATAGVVQFQPSLAYSGATPAVNNRLSTTVKVGDELMAPQPPGMSRSLAERRAAQENRVRQHLANLAQRKEMQEKQSF